MTDSPVLGPEPITRVYLWLGQPDVGTEHLLMVHVNDPEAGPMYRPLMAIDRETALAPTVADLAGQAAFQLGVRAVLREYAVFVVDQEPQVLASIEPTPTVGSGQ